MAKVLFRQSSYSYDHLKPVIAGIMDSLSGSSLGPGAKVLIKPNFLAPAPPEKAMLTHPQIVRAVVEYLNDKGVRPRLSDSPAMGTFEKVLEKSGVGNAIRGLEVEGIAFRDSAGVDVGKPFNRIEIAADAMEADVVINLPKLKTHQHMLLTLGVKNLFGCIVGIRKPEWHFRTGVDRDKFAELLVRIHEAIRPSITILDGILAMEGQGPGRSGKPRALGVLAASDNAVALDHAVCRMLGIDPDRVPTNRAARRLGAVPDQIDLDGDFPVVDNFSLPTFTSLVFGPAYLHGFMRKHMAQRPEEDEDLCRMCGECWKYCPAKAISNDGNHLRFDYDTCIRCYCCQEVCPHGAITARETVLGTIFKKAIEKRLKSR